MDQLVGNDECHALPVGYGGGFRVDKERGLAVGD